MNTKQLNTREIKYFSNHQLKNSYLNSILGGEKKIGAKAEEDVE